MLLVHVASYTKGNAILMFDYSYFFPSLLHGMNRLANMVNSASKY